MGGHVPPPQDAVSALIKKNNNKTHDMICVIQYCLTCDLDYPDDDGLPSKGGRGGTDWAVSVTRACKSPVVWSQRIKHVCAPPIPLGNLGW